MLARALQEEVATLEKVDRGLGGVASADLWAVIAGTTDARTLSSQLDGVRAAPEVRTGTITWRLDAPPERVAAATAVLTWFDIEATTPGRVRACGNPECTLFFIDRSRSNSARWCSMAVCGNGMKARRHQERSRATSHPSGTART